MTLALDGPPPGSSWVHRLDPRWRLGALVLAAAACAFLHNPVTAGIALGAALTLAGLARIPCRWFGSRLGLALIMLALFVCWRPFVVRASEPAIELLGIDTSLAGWRTVGTLLARAGAALTLMLVLVATAPLHDTLKAAHALHVPQVFVQLATLSYRYVLLLADEFGRLRQALRVRGFRNRADRHSYRTIGHVAGTLLVRSHEQAERVAQAMRCRGFDGRYRSLHEFRTRPSDVLASTVIAAVAAALLWWDWSRG
jgi:cobalt/nickel transport system permease protein